MPKVELGELNLEMVDAYYGLEGKEYPERLAHRFLVERLQAGVTEHLFSNEDPANLILRLHEIVKQDGSESLIKALQWEKRYKYGDEPLPLYEFVKVRGADPEDVANLGFGDIFVENLLSQLNPNNPLLDLKDLYRWREVFKNVGIWEVLSNTYEMYKAGSGNGSWVRPVFDLVHKASGNPGGFTIPPEQLDALYLISYLPYPIRPLTRRLIIGNVIMDQMRNKLGVEDAEAIEALDLFYRSDALSGYYWDELLKGQVEGEKELSFILGLFNEEKQAALGKLQQLSNEGDMTSVSVAWKEITTNLNDIIEKCEHHDKTSLWRHQDTGHCFSHFDDNDLFYILNGRRDYMYYYGDKDKSDRKAFILDDDPGQLSRYEGIVKRHTKYRTNKSLCCETPEEIMEVLNDPEIGLFLIDVEGKEGRPVGIPVAEEIFNILMKRIKEGSLTKGSPIVNIIVWSMSPEAVDLASRSIRQMMDDYPDQSLINDYVEYSLGNNGNISKSYAQISISCMIKRFDSFKFIE